MLNNRGLDEFSATECIKLFKRLVTTGRTIICSIHTPSARLFEMFDKVYVLADGRCVYQGSTKNILSYLSKFDLYCPLTYNPADFSEFSKFSTIFSAYRNHL